MALFIHCGLLLWTRKSPGMEVSFLWNLATSLSPIISGSHPSFGMPLSRITKVVELLTWKRYNRFLTLSPIPLHRLPPGMLKYRSECVPSMLKVLPTFPWNPSALKPVPPLSLCPSANFVPSPLLPSTGAIKAWLGQLGSFPRSHIAP